MLYFLSYVFIAISLLLAFSGLPMAVKYPVKYIFEYQWIFYGVAIYFIIYRFQILRKNRDWRHTVAHELAHAIITLLFGGRIYSFQAGRGEGMIQHSKPRFGDIFVTLAPYCLPYFTYLVMLVRIIGDEKFLFLFDIFAGITLGFHLCCFWTQARPHQTDLKTVGVVRSYMFIFAALAFNLSIILLTVHTNIFKAFATLFQCYWDNIIQFFGWIFS